MISRAGWWTWIPSATPLTPLQPKKWSAHFWITFNFWWLAGLVDGLKPHPPPLSRQKNEMLIFGVHWTSDNRLDGSMDSNPICYPSPAKKMKCSFLGYVQLLMIGRAGQWIQTPSTTHLQPKKWNAYFWITFNFWWSARLVDGLKRHPPPLSSQRMKCSFLDYVQLLMISWAGQWTRIPSATPLQTKKWYAHFCITFNFWWLARLVNGLEPHPPALSSQRMKCSFLDYIQLLMIGWAGQWTRTSSTTPFQAKKWNAYFCIMFNFWWSAGLVDGLKHHLLPLSSQKNEMLIFVLCSTSGDQPGWLMESNPICHPSQVKKMKCSFLYYIQLLMIGRAGHRTQTPSTSPLKPKKNEMLIFGLHLTSDDQPGWSMDSNPIHDPSPTKKMKCSFLDYVELLIVCWAGQWTQTPSTSPLKPRKMKCLFLDYI